MRLVDEVTSPARLLHRCDLGLLKKIARRLNGVEPIDEDVVARLLYGGVRGQKMLDHVSELVDELQ